MFSAAFKALGDVLSPEFRSVLWRAIGLSLALFLLIFASVQSVFWFLTLVPWPWLESLLAIGAGLVLIVAFIFLMAPVTSLFAGLYLDNIAAKVERLHYPNDRPGVPLAGFKAIITAIQFGLIVLVANVLALPMIFLGFGIIVLFVINAYLLSREYFEMVAMRFMPPEEAKEFRRVNAVNVFIAGFLPAVLSIIPFVNLLVPLFSTSYFVHLFKQAQRSSA
jgi:CysZ protein